MAERLALRKKTLPKQNSVKFNKKKKMKEEKTKRRGKHTLECMEGTKVAGTVKKVIFSSARNCAGYMHQISHAFKTVMTCFCKARCSEVCVSRAPHNAASTSCMVAVMLGLELIKRHSIQPIRPVSCVAVMLARLSHAP
jgi:hypothetical protein